MSEYVNALANNGVAIVVLGYFMYMFNTTLKDVISTLKDVTNALNNNTIIINKLYDKID